MDEKLIQKIEEQNKKIEELIAVVERMKKYFQITVWLTVGVFVLPLILAIVVVPLFLDAYLGMMDLSALDGLI